MHYVLGAAGEKYGPADLATLRQWMTEGRVNEATILEDAATGQQLAARGLPGLFGPAAPASGTPYGPAAQPGNPQPYSPVSQPGTSHPYSPVAGSGQVHPANVDPHSGMPSQSPYVRYDSTRDFSRNNSLAQSALAMIIISFVCCVSGAWWSLALSIGALVCSIQLKKAGHERGPLYTTLSIVSLSLNTVMFILNIVFTVAGMPGLNLGF